MNEFFLVYDTATGEILWRGTGIPGTAALQSLPAGQAILQVPADIWSLSPLPIEDLQAVRWEQVKTLRAVAEAGGCLTPAGVVDTDIESLVRITGAVQAASIALAAGDALNLDWTMADNTTVTLNAVALVAMGRAVAVHVDAAHQHARALRDLIDAAEDVETLLAIDITADWPGVGGEG